MSLIRGLFNCIPLANDQPADMQHGMRLLFDCPGCKQLHGPVVGGVDPHNGASWTWNGDYIRPTFAPSLLVRWSEPTPEQVAQSRWFYKLNGRYLTQTEQPNALQMVCHSYINDGMIQFLGDCTHALAGKTVPIPGWDNIHAP